MQVIENWSDLDTEVVEATSATTEAAPELVVRVHAVRPVAGFANLLERHRGDTIRVRVPTLDAAGLPTPGQRLRLRVRVVGPSMFVGVLPADP